MSALAAKLWLPVRYDAIPMDLTWNNGNELWSATRPIVQRIQPEDSMTLWPDADDYDPSGGPLWPVKEVYWDSSGRMNIEMALMIVNPSDEVRAAYTSKIQHGMSDIFKRTRLWSTDDGRRLDADLLRGGWRQ